MDEGVETVEYGDLHDFYSTVEGRRSTETQSQYVQIIKRLRKLLDLDDEVKLYDVDAKEILKVIYKDSFHANGKMKTKSKSHQRGAERGEEHKFSIYSNPLNPEVDIFLALGIKILTTTLVQENAPLYRSTEKDHFARWLQRQVELHEQEQSELRAKPDIGVQSLRKGAITFCLAFPGAASAISALLRAGYLLGGVLPRYVALAIEGDCNVSRILCGLPAQSEDLALLPARFKPNQRVNWRDFICDLDSYPAEFQACIPYLVASVVYHSEWLLTQLPSEHGLFQTRFWRSGYHNSLRVSILTPVRMFCPETGMRATGVSPLTVVLDRIASLPTVSHAPLPPSAQSSNAATEEAAPPVLAPIVAQLDSLAASVAQLTAAVSALTPQSIPAAGVMPVVTPMQLRQAITEDFPWPKHIPLRQIYMLWYEGLNWHGNLYPLSKVPAKNLNLNTRKYVSYAKACVAAIDDHLRADFRYQTNCEQDQQFKSACSQLALQLIACGHEATEEAIISKLICNDYASLYINDLKFLR